MREQVVSQASIYSVEPPDYFADQSATTCLLSVPLVILTRPMLQADSHQISFNTLQLAEGILGFQLLPDGLCVSDTCVDTCMCVTWQLSDDILKQLFASTSLVLLDLASSNFRFELKGLRSVRSLCLSQVFVVATLFLHRTVGA